MADNILELASQVQTQYKDGLAYKKQQGYLDSWAEYERFRSGDQWPRETKRTRDLPRPTFNVIDQIQGHKVSSVMNENIKMVFSAMENLRQPSQDEQEIDPSVKAADTFTRFADTTWERIKQDDINEEALDSASNTGTCVWHYYWDASKSGGNRLRWIGEMEGETIDIVNFFPGNPQNRDVQKQPYILITHRNEIQNIKEEAKANKVSKEYIEMITPDKDTEDQAYDKAKNEISSSSKATVITKYWRENGFIHFMKVCGNVVVKLKTNTNRKLYPIEVMQWKRRKKSIFGVGDTEGLIPNQKSINFLIAMQIKSVQDTGWPKMLIKRGENGIRQNPTNTPGEILVDSAPPGQWSAQYMNPGNISPHAQALVDNIMQYTKEVSGANESAMGEQISSDLNASAIMMLQKAAGIPIESIKRRFYQSMENIARIWLEFWQVNYNTTRLITIKDDEQEEYTTEFNGSVHKDLDLQVKVDIGPSSGYSETMMMSTLDKLYDKGDIDVTQYLKFVPPNVAPFKERLLKDIQKRQEQAMMQQDEMFNQMLSQLSPEEQQAYLSAPPEVQSQIKAEMMQGQQQGAPQQPMQQQPTPIM